MAPKKRPRGISKAGGVHGSDEHGDVRPGPPGKRRAVSKAVASGMVSTFFATENNRLATTGRRIADLRIESKLQDDGKLRSIIASLPERFPTEKAALFEQMRSKFGNWWSQWHAGYNLLLYGYGSKRKLLRTFATECSGDGACLEIDGLQKGTTARQILAHVAALASLEKPSRFHSSPIDDMLATIAQEAPERKIYVVIHNIDGPSLRDVDSQRVLGDLAALSNVHLAASIDHVNAPVLWDLQCRDRFRWLWHHVATFQPYVDEIVSAAVPSLLVGRKEACTQQSALVVLSSLANTARQVFRLIASTQLDHDRHGGITFQNLFSSCREQFLVSNEMLLKTFLTEFRDHDLLVTKRREDGSELLTIPLGREALEAVLAEMDAH